MADFLSGTAQIPIADLSPLLPEISTRSIRAIVTLIWPYSSSNSSLTVLLAEPDFRLRRNRGQVRVQFWGSNAKSVFENGIGSGDEVILSLQGAEWIESESTNQTPGRGIDWELKFAGRLLIKILENETHKVTLLDTDHPEPRSGLEPVSVTSTNGVADNGVADNDVADAVPSSSSITSQLHGSAIFRAGTGEWTSPAFVKRARISYGSLLDSGVDIFASDDETMEGRSRKRTRFGRQSNSWRYSSRLPSPEHETSDTEMVDDNSPRGTVGNKPLMTDEGCQTEDINDDATEVLANLSWQREAANNTLMLLDEDTRSLVAQETVQKETTEVSVPMANSASFFHLPSSSFPADSDLRTEGSQNPDVDADSAPPASPQLCPVSSDALPLVSPLESRALDTSNWQHAENDSVDRNHTHWLEGLELQARERRSPFGEILDEDLLSTQLESDLTTKKGAVPPKNIGDSQEAIGIIHKGPDDEGDKENNVATHSQLSRSVSPRVQENVIEQSFPEHSAHEHQNYVQGSDLNHGNRRNSPLTYPTNDDNIQTYPGLDRNLLSSPSRKLWHGAEQIEHPSKLSRVGPLYASNNLGSPVSIAMSRAHSEPLRPVRLTEDWNSGRERQKNFSLSPCGKNSPRYLLELNKGGFASQSRDDIAEAEFDESQGEGECTDGDAEDQNGDFTQFQSAESNLWNDGGMDPWENSEEYDEDRDQSEGELAPAMTKPPTESIPEVIILLSSGGEESSCNESDKGSEDNDMRDESIRVRDGPRFINGPNETLTRYLIHDSLPNEDENDENDFGDGEYSDQDLDEDLESSISGSQDFQDEEVFVHQVERDMADADPEEDCRTEGTDNSDVNISPFDIQLKSFNGSGHLEAEIEVDRNAETSQPSDHSPVQSDNSKYSPSNGKIGTFGGDDVLSRNQSPTSEPRPPHTAHGEVNQIYLVSTDEPGPANNTYPITHIGQINVEAPKQGNDVGTDYNEPINFQLPTPNATQEIFEGESFDSPIKVEPVVYSPRQALFQKESVITSAVEGIASHSPTDLSEANPPTPMEVQHTPTDLQSEKTESSSPLLLCGAPTPQGYDASAELAIAELASPTEQMQSTPAPSDGPIQGLLTRLIRTDFGEFTALSLVCCNLEKKLDILAIVTNHSPEPQRAKLGPCDFHVRFNVTDPSIAPSVTEIQIFRPHEEALPVVQPGDGVLLRNFQVKPERNRGFTLQSENNSSWLIFKRDGMEEMPGPPVELGNEEREHMGQLQRWFNGLNVTWKEKPDEQVEVEVLAKEL